MNKKNKKLNKFILLPLIAFIGCYSGDMPEYSLEYLPDNERLPLLNPDSEVPILPALDPLFDIERFMEKYDALEGLQGEMVAQDDGLENAAQFEDYSFDLDEREEPAAKRTRVEPTEGLGEDLKYRYKCGHPKCNRVFATLQSRASHIRVHSGKLVTSTSEKPYKCEWSDCGKSYDFKSYLDRHMFTHTKEVSYKCGWLDCDKSFDYKSDLNRHARKHTYESPYICYWLGCDKPFVQKPDLDEHIARFHINIKLFLCDKPGCGLSFSTRKDLERHKCKAFCAGKRSRTSKTEDFRCMICLFTCETSEEMRVHRGTCK